MNEAIIAMVMLCKVSTDFRATMLQKQQIKCFCELYDKSDMANRYFEKICSKANK